MADPDLGDGLRARVEQLERGLRQTTLRAETEAACGAPGGMVAVYVELEARHALAGHQAPEHGVDCTPCHQNLGGSL